MKYIKIVFVIWMSLILMYAQDESNTTKAIKLTQEAKKYFRQFMQDNNTTMLKKSYETVAKAYLYDKNNQQIQSTYYIIGLVDLSVFKEQKVLEDLKKLFPIAYKMNLNPAPPSYLDMICLSNQADTKQKIKLLKKAIQENRKFSESYIMLASFYAEIQQYDLAIDILNRGLQNIQSDELRFHYLLAIVYQEKSYFLDDKLECAVVDKTLLKHIIQESKAVLRLKPDIDDMYYNLALAYERLGQPTLSIETMHQALKYNNTQENQRKYEEFLLQNGAKDEFFKRIKNGKGSGDLQQLANGYFYSQDWENVIRVLKKHISQDNTKHFYTYLKYAVAVSKIKGNQAGKKILQNLPTDIQSNPWINLLTKYYLDQVDDKELLAQADNACKKTEAYFWIGVRQIGYDNQKAKQNFQNVLKEKVYSYVEYAISNYYLKEGIK